MKEVLIHEIFVGVQGEGVRAGVPSTFVRFYGCPRNCAFCDTDQSGIEPKPMLIDAIRAVCVGHGLNDVVLTGGEPLAQFDEEAGVNLCAELSRSLGLVYPTIGSRTIETAARFDEFKGTLDLRVDLLSVSPKEGTFAEQVQTVTGWIEHTHISSGGGLMPEVQGKLLVEDIHDLYNAAEAILTECSGLNQAKLDCMVSFVAQPITPTPYVPGSLGWAFRALQENQELAKCVARVTRLYNFRILPQVHVCALGRQEPGI